MAAVTICSDFGTQENSLSLFPHLFVMKWWDRMPWSSFFECRVLSQLFHSLLSLSSRGSSSSSLSAIRVLSSAHLNYWYFSQKSWFHLGLHPAQHWKCTLHYKLNKQGDNIQPWFTPFQIWNQSIVPCPVLTVASCPAYRFLRSMSGGLVFPSL